MWMSEDKMENFSTLISFESVGRIVQHRFFFPLLTTVTKHPFLFLDVTSMEISLKKIDPCQLNSSQLKQPQTSHGVKSKVGAALGPTSGSPSSAMGVCTSFFKCKSTEYMRPRASFSVSG